MGTDGTDGDGKDGKDGKDTTSYVPKPPSLTPGGSSAPTGFVGVKPATGAYLLYPLNHDDISFLATGKSQEPQPVDKSIARFHPTGDVDMDREWNRDHVMVDPVTGKETPPTGGERFSGQQSEPERATPEDFRALKEPMETPEPASRDAFAEFKAGRGGSILPEAQRFSEGFNEKSGFDR